MVGLRKHGNGPWDFVTSRITIIFQKRAPPRVVRVFNLGVLAHTPKSTKTVTTAYCCFPSLVCHSAEMSATSEANKKMIVDAIASMARPTPFTIGAASFLERLCTLLS